MNNLTIGQLIEALPQISGMHARTNPVYKVFEKAADVLVNGSDLKNTESAVVDMGGFGNINFPYQRFGAIDSLDLFGLDELIIFAYYLVNKNSYKKTYDIGANIGIHSIVMSLAGWQVTSIEPDPVHMQLLKRNLSLNNINTVSTREAAVSDKEGELEFVRVVGNTTSSHLSGAKQPYGDLERFPVKVLAIKDIMKDADFIKMDVEGIEKTVILATDKSDWVGTEMMLEIGTEANAKAIYEHLTSIGVNAFSQKTGWLKAASLTDIPTSYKEGSVFISGSDKMNW